MNYNKARAVINRVMLEKGYVGKCTHPINQYCANLGKGERFCNVTMQKSCTGCRFATIGGSGERILTAEKIIDLEYVIDDLKRDIKHTVKEKDATISAEINKRLFITGLLEGDISDLKHEQRTALYLAKRGRNRRKAMY